MHPNVLFWSLNSNWHDVEYDISRTSNELNRLENRIDTLQADLSHLVSEIENRLEIDTYSKAI